MTETVTEYRFPPTSELFQDPYPAYAELRAAFPVHRVAESSWYVVPGASERSYAQGDWVVSRYQDVRDVSRDWRRYTVRFTKTGLSVPNILEVDPPVHKQRRGFQSKIIAPRRLEKYGERIRSFAVELIEAFVERGELEAKEDLCYPLALYTMSGMLGFDNRENYHWLREWAAGFQGSGSTYRAEGTLERQAAAWADLRAYVTGLLEERIDAPQDDLLTELLDGQREKLGGEIDMETLSIDAAAVLQAGMHTTASQLANALLLLADNPDQAERVWSDRSLIPAMIEESLRVESAAQWVARLVTEDVEIAGVQVPSGAKLILLLGSANRDETVFPEPERFDVTRANATDHVAFGGGGPHVCLGAPLARLEMRIAFEELIDRVRWIRVATDRADLRWQEWNLVFRAPQSLPLAFDRV